MDTITHGIAGALIGKAIFRGDDMFASRPMNRGRIITWSLMLGAIFPDSDVFRDIFSHDRLLVITWHRSITHSLILLPLWALLLAWITHWFAKGKEWRGPVAVAISKILGLGILSGVIRRWLTDKKEWEAPSFGALVGIYAAGILSHILLDLVTSFGTMIWSPLQWSRPAWDIIFIIDFTFTALLLLPQLLAWSYERREHQKVRVLIIWALLLPVPLIIGRIGLMIGAPIDARFIVGAILLLSAVFLIPAAMGWGVRVGYVTWNRAGFLAASCYLLAAFFAHHA